MNTIPENFSSGILLLLASQTNVLNNYCMTKCKATVKWFRCALSKVFRDFFIPLSLSLSLTLLIFFFIVVVVVLVWPWLGNVYVMSSSFLAFGVRALAPNFVWVVNQKECNSCALESNRLQPRKRWNVIVIGLPLFNEFPTLTLAYSISTPLCTIYFCIMHRLKCASLHLTALCTDNWNCRLIC